MVGPRIGTQADIACEFLIVNMKFMILFAACLDVFSRAFLKALATGVIKKEVVMRNSFWGIRLALAAVCAVCAGSLPAYASHCSAAGVAGKWSYSYSGTVYAPDPFPAAAVGHFHSDANGNVTGSQTHTLAGQTEQEDVSGTATVNADCTGTANINVLVNGQIIRSAVLNIVYDENENHARLIFVSITLPDGTSLPSVVTMEASRMFPTE